MSFTNITENVVSPISILRTHLFKTGSQFPSTIQSSRYMWHEIKWPHFPNPRKDRAEDKEERCYLYLTERWTHTLISLYPSFFWLLGELRTIYKELSCGAGPGWNAWAKAVMVSGWWLLKRGHLSYGGRRFGSGSPLFLWAIWIALKTTRLPVLSGTLALLSVT